MTSTLKFLHVAGEQPDPNLFTPAFRRALEPYGTLAVVPGARRMAPEQVAALVRGCDVLLTGWGCAPVPAAVAADRGALRWICHLTGTMVGSIPLAIIEAGIPVTNWGDAPAFWVAEGAFALLMACVKDLRPQIEAKRGGAWRLSEAGAARTGSLRNLRLGLYGCGVIGRVFVELCAPFRPAAIRVFDPYAESLPAGTERAGSLRELFATCDAVAIHAGLTDETRGTVTAELLALLPDGGIVVNTARGGVVVQEALLREVGAGRLRAGLDVLEGSDALPAGHPAREYQDLILTAHQVSTAGWPKPDAETHLSTLHEVALENIRRFAAGEPLRFAMDAARYRRST